ncbi:MAG: hypothetical protein QNL62_20990 [Gammaproteobacteria bacterium]|nr:hypothetical protein [Gammaproteobacteria bacterium]
MKQNASQITITVRAAGILDLRALGLMNSIYKFARHYSATRIIFDLRQTHRIQDSGLAMLLLLENKLGQQIEKIKLVSTRHLNNNHLGYLPVRFVIN